MGTSPLAAEWVTSPTSGLGRAGQAPGGSRAVSHPLRGPGLLGAAPGPWRPAVARCDLGHQYSMGRSHTAEGEETAVVRWVRGAGVINLVLQGELLGRCALRAAISPGRRAPEWATEWAAGRAGGRPPAAAAPSGGR